MKMNLKMTAILVLMTKALFLLPNKKSKFKFIFISEQFHF